MKFLSITSLLLSLVFSGHAFTANDAAESMQTDGSYADTVGALAYIATKAQDGWVMTIGSAGGSYVWTNEIQYTTANAITIQGADPNNRPQIAFNTTAREGLYLNASASNHLVTLKDLAFTWVSNQPYANLVTIEGNGVCFRVTNCKFLAEPLLKHVLQIGSINTDYNPGPYGLIDHCQWPMAFADTYNLINVEHNGDATTTGYTNYGWTLPMSWGTTNTVVIEDCSFSLPNINVLGAVIEADAAARFCLRHCNITNLTVSSHGVASGAKQSTLQVEMYQNNFVLTPYSTNAVTTQSYLFWQRGGSCVVWSNTIADNYYWDLAKVFYFSVECASSLLGTEGACSNTLVYPANYPGYQQVGRGVVNGAEGSAPCYVWGNTTPATAYGDFQLGVDSGDAPFMQMGRDVYTNAMPGYSALVYPHPLATSPVVTATPTLIQAGPAPPSSLHAIAPTSQ
jgi:hypothetical protein